MREYIIVGAIVAGGFIAGLLWYPLLFSGSKPVDVLIAEECVDIPSPPALPAHHAEEGWQI